MTQEERQEVIRSSVMQGHYEKTIDRESAYEILQARAGQAQAAAMAEAAAKQRAKESAQTGKMIESMARSAARSVGTQIGRQLSRGVLGTLFGWGKKMRLGWLVVQG